MLRDLEQHLPMAPNFRYLDFVKSSTAARYGIWNIPPTEEHWQSIERVAGNILQPVRNEFGPIVITSGYRCVELCLKVGSSPTSNHVRGEAIDFEPLNRNIKLITIIEWIDRNLPYRELIAEFFPIGWVHAAYRLNKNVKQMKLKDESHNYSRISMPELLTLYKS